MTRVVRLREYIDGLFLSSRNMDKRHVTYVHLYGVSLCCAILARRRGLDEEMAMMAGMLHDIHTLQYGYVKEHAELGAPIARGILERLELAIPEEIDVICRAIKKHSDKETVHEPFDELLKDGDVLQHCMYESTAPVAEKERQRFDQLCRELHLMP